VDLWGDGFDRAMSSRALCGKMLRPPSLRGKICSVSVLTMAVVESSIHITNILFLLTLPEQNDLIPAPEQGAEREPGWDCPLLKLDVVRY
jgi:hypothetical protein